MNKKWNKIEILLLVIVMWVNITSGICWFKNPSLSKMEIALRIPRSFILDFEG